MKIKLLVIVILLSACTTWNKNSASKFEPFKNQAGDQHFNFFARSNMFSPSDTPEGESERMEWLQLWLNDNQICKNGYVIVERKVVATGALSEAVKHIFYTGKCK